MVKSSLLIQVERRIHIAIKGNTVLL